MRRIERVQKKGLYRSRNGILLGVCKGFAEYFHFSTNWVRAILVICFILSGFWPILGLYFLAALIMKPEPVRSAHIKAERAFYDDHVSSPKGAAERLRKRYEDMERRLRRMEDRKTTREFDWDRRLNT